MNVGKQVGAIPPVPSSSLVVGNGASQPEPGRLGDLPVSPNVSQASVLTLFQRVRRGPSYDPCDSVITLQRMTTTNEGGCGARARLRSKALTAELRMTDLVPADKASCTVG